MNLSGTFLVPLAFSSAAAVTMATLGGLLTELGPWYAQLKRPSWQPPDWAFGPIWSIILALGAVAAALAWQAAPEGPARKWLLAVLIANGILHVMWSALFFKLHRPDWAFIEVILLWLSIVALIVVLGYHSKVAGLLITPYLAWVTAAAILNYQIVILNGPFK